MKIDSIQIKNVRGLSDKILDLEMIPNKPSVLVAPNGTGKSSFALAFERLKVNGIKLEKGDYFQDVETNRPEINIVADGTSFNATDAQNNISSTFAIQVINSRNKPQTIKRKIEGNNVYSTKMTVPPIVLAKVPSNDSFTYNFKVDNQLEGFQQGVITKIDFLLDDETFMISLDANDINRKHQTQTIQKFINNIRTYIGQGTKEQIFDKIQNNDLSALKRISAVTRLVEKLRAMPTYADKHEAKIYLDAIQLIFVYNTDKEIFKNRIKRFQYLKLKERYMSLFKSLKGTWKNIYPKEVEGKLIVEIENSEQLSNGERDIIVFLTMLERVKMNLNKTNNILIIDEIFDYLDDANFISAQYYITKYIEEYKEENKRIRAANAAQPAGSPLMPEKNFFPIILTHLDPVTFKQFGYKDLKVYYFDDYTNAYTSDNMKHLIHLRDRLEKEDKRNGTHTDLISEYLLHYHNQPKNLDETLADQRFSYWKNPVNFKNYCKSEAEKYINNAVPFDPVAVCIWLRECVEKKVFDGLQPALQQVFLQIHGTKNKLQYAVENNIEYPEIFALLGLIYNNSLHLGANGETRSDISLASKLQNNTIKAMIKSVMDTYAP